MNRSVILKGFLLLFVFILVFETVFNNVYSGWTFRAANLVVLNKVITYFSLFGLFFCLVILLRVPRILAVVFGIILFLLFSVASCSAMFPLDTFSEPVDHQVLQKYPDGKKMIIRQHKNEKTGMVISDTVLVKDLLIFRRIYKK